MLVLLLNYLVLQQYIDLLSKIISANNLEEGRNGNVFSTFGENMRFDLSNGKMPILTTKKVAWKTCLKELLWFIRGQTDVRILQSENVHIWDDNGSRDFLDSRGLFDREVDDLGPVYGHQWRHFNAKYTGCDESYEGKGVDQLAHIITCLKNPDQRSSRRMIMSAWNPCQLSEMALPPCHCFAQFYVTHRSGAERDSLSCQMYQRSCDLFLGVPFNIASYSLLTHMIAQVCDLKVGEFVHVLGDAHIYSNHMDQVNEQLSRTPKALPRMKINPEVKNIFEFKFEDFVLENYEPDPAIKAPVAV